MGKMTHLDTPSPAAAVYADCISVSGWVHAPGFDMSQCHVRAWLGDSVIGETRLIFVRPDVCAALGLPPDTKTGFRFLGRAVTGGGGVSDAEIRVTASWPPDPKETRIGQTSVRLFPSPLRQRPYGDVVHPTQTRVLHREDIYGSGPPAETPGAEMLRLIQEYLTPGASVLDVGCGAGAYGPGLIARGHQWLGLEVNPVCLAMLARHNLPHRAATRDSGAFPCSDAEFDEAICIEVLEHIADVRTFLKEMRRVCRRRALFSVPNMEVIPYLSAWQVVPWHLLEADHKNFFTRASLISLLSEHFRRVEVFSVAEHPIRTPDDVPLHVHLFAVAEK